MTADYSKIFVGRDAETSHLTDLLDEAVQGRGQIVMITGEAGIGKSRLVAELGALATQRQTSVVTGRSRELAGAPPFWLWIQTLTALLGDDHPEIAKLRTATTNDDAGVLSDSARFQLFESIARVLQESARTQPLLVVLENLHWADSASMQLLEFLSFDINSMALMVVGTTRNTETADDHPLTRFMDVVSRDPHYTHIPVPELGQKAIGELIESVAGITPSTSLVRAVQDHTQGNALFAIETVRLLDRAGELTPGNISQRSDWKLGVPEEIRSVLARRFASLPAPTVELLQTAAVIGREFTIALLSSITKLDPTDILQSLDEPVASGIVIEEQTSDHDFRFSHALFREALLDLLSLSKRIALHASAVVVIGNGSDKPVPENVGTLAYHSYEAIPLIGKYPAIIHSIVAGNHALQLTAYDTAEQCFRQALDLLSDRTQTNEWAEASAGIARALRFTTTESDVGAVGPHLGNAWNYYVTNGRLDEAIDLAALPLSGDERSKLAHLALVKKTLEFTDDHSRVAGYLLNNLARGMLSNPSGYEAANEHLQNALKIADAHDDLNLRATLLRSLVENRHFHGVKSDEDAELLESAMESARTANAPGIEADCARGATYLALQRGDGPAAVRFGEQAVGAAERSRQRNTLVQCLASHGAAYEAVANWEGFFSVVNRSLELDPENSAVLAQKIRIEEILGRSADVDRHLAKLSEISNNKHAEHFDQVNFAGVLATTSDRKPEYIARALSLARRQAQRTDVPKRVIAQAYGIIGLLGYATGSSELAQKALEFTENNPETLLGDPVAEFHHGLVLTMLGRIDEGIETIGRLHQQFEPALFPAQSTHFSILLARALASRSTSEDIQQANDLLNTTEDSIRKHQLHGLTIRVMAVRKLLAEITGKTRRADGLTKRELEILSLVATGRNNPEIAEELFISRHTVVSHLSNIFEKIDVENRAQAAAYAVEHSIA